MKNRTPTKLKSITTKIGSGATPTGGEKAYKAEGISLIRSLNVYDFVFQREGLAFIDEQQAAQLDNVQVASRDILLNITGASVARCCMVPDSVLPARVNQHVSLVRIDPHKADPYYVLACINSPRYKSELLGIAQGGATREALTKSKIENFEIPLPALTTQRKIAGVLSAYDDLIENNTRRIAILEEMAQAIYREWFVNFRFPGHEKVKLVKSPLGKIPEGWKLQTIGSTLEFHIGGGWGQENVDEEFSNPAFVIRGTDIPDARSLRVVDCPLRYHTDSNIRTRKLSPDDLVFEVSGGSKEQPVGRCLFVSERLLKRFDGDVICASFCKVIRANPAILAPEILYHYLVESYANGTIEQYEVQSTGIKNFKFTVFLESESLAVPPAKTQQAFLAHIRPILDTVHAIGKKNEVLRTTRDLLLPKLISGQLDVAELDIETGEPLVEAEA